MSTGKDVSKFTIVPARSPRDLEDTRELFTAYANWLNVDLSFQDFASELKSLPGRYAPSQGEILLVRDSDDVSVGCVAVRPLHSNTSCEMKRLYVVPTARGFGLGQTLVDEVVQVAIKLGYTEMKLDTLGHMDRAIELYKRCGFRVVDQYYGNPLANVVYLAKDLVESSS